MGTAVGVRRRRYYRCSCKHNHNVGIASMAPSCQMPTMGLLASSCIHTSKETARWAHCENIVWRWEDEAQWPSLGGAIKKCIRSPFSVGFGLDVLAMSHRQTLSVLFFLACRHTLPFGLLHPSPLVCFHLQ